MSKTLYDSKEVKEILSIGDKELRLLRESGSISHMKFGRSYKYELNEELAKTFIPKPKDTGSFSTTTDSEHLEKKLGDEDLTFPVYTEYSSYTTNKKLLQVTKIQERDQLIQIYRTVAEKPEVSNCVDEIINEILSPFETGELLKLGFDDKDKKIGDATKSAVKEAFNKVLSLVDFNNEADELIRDWYRDGFVPFEVVYDNDKIKNGIKRIVQLTPFDFKRVHDLSDNSYFYTYQQVAQAGLEVFGKQSVQGAQWLEEQIVIAKSGKLDPTKTYDSSYLREALKAINDLSHIENSIVVYRITRANEKNVWNIDVGNLPAQKAKNHLNSIARDVNTNIKYNAETGQVSTDVAVGIQSNWIFPSRNGKQKTEVQTIDGNADFISKLEDLNYFKRKVNEALKIPIGRLDQESSLDFSSEDILREELKFSLFVNKLRRRFSETFFKPLIKRELLATGKITVDEWDKVKQLISFKWNNSNAIVEKAHSNNIKSKMESLAEVKDSGLIGTYVSMQYVLENILQMTADEFEEQKKQIEKEKEQGWHQPEEEPTNQYN